MILAGNAHRTRGGRRFLARERPRSRCQAARPLTPDHVIRTKQLAAGRARTSTSTSPRYTRLLRPQPVTGLARRRSRCSNPAPRVCPRPATSGYSHRRTGRCATPPSRATSTSHTIDAIESGGEARGVARADRRANLFDVEYWELEQAKLARAGAPAQFAGEIRAGDRRGRRASDARSPNCSWPKVRRVVGISTCDRTDHRAAPKRRSSVSRADVTTDPAAGRCGPRWPRSTALRRARSFWS